MEKTNFAARLQENRLVVSEKSNEELSQALIKEIQSLKPMQLQWLGSLIAEASEQNLRASLIREHEDSLMGITPDSSNKFRRESLVKFSKIGSIFSEVGSRVSSKKAADFFSSVWGK